MKNQLFFSVVYPRGTKRPVNLSDGTVERWTKYDTGYLTGEARRIPGIVCPGVTENDIWYLVNLRDSNNVYLQTVGVLGALDREQAVYAALQTFGSEYPTCNGTYVVEAPAFALKRFLDIEQPYAGEISFDAIRQCIAQVVKKPVNWDRSDCVSSHGSMSNLMLEMAQLDIHGELLEPVKPKDAVDLFIGEDGVVSQYDALITSYAGLKLLHERLATAMAKAAVGDITVTEVTETKPFKRNNVVNVAVIYSLSDGQTISVVFNNPDSTPGTLASGDTLTSWKWLLNKRDVSIVLQPKNGEDVQLNQLAIRMMKLIHGNSARFKRTMAKRLENENLLATLNQKKTDLDGEESALDAEINDLQAQLDQASQAKTIEPSSTVDVSIAQEQTLVPDNSEVLPPSDITADLAPAVVEDTVNQEPDPKPAGKTYPPIKDLGNGYYQAFKNEKMVDSWTAHINTSNEWEVSANNAQTRAWNRGFGMPKFFKTIEEMIAKYPAFTELPTLLMSNSVETDSELLAALDADNVALEASTTDNSDNEVNSDQDYLQSIIDGTADLTDPDTVETRLTEISERLDDVTTPLFEQAAEAFAQYAIAQAATV